MNSEIVTYLIIGIILGAIIGVIFTNVLSQNARKYRKVKDELDETKQELTKQKQLIVQHFSHSAEILDNMAKEFRRLYQHMSENSNNLISSKDLDTLEPISLNPITKDPEPEIEKLDGEIPPKDYSGNPSGLFKQEGDKQ